MNLIILGILIVAISSSFIFSTSFAQETITEVIIIKQLVHKVVDGKLVVIEEDVEATRTFSPTIHLDECTWAGGEIRWDASFDGPKVLPDLQKVIDTGAENLCVTIISKYDPDLTRDKVSQVAKDMRITIEKFLKDNGATVSSQREVRVTYALIPASLLDDLVAHDYVGNVDVYGKTYFIPEYLFLAYDSKISPLIQLEKEEGRQNCSSDYTDLSGCPLLLKNSDGDDVFYVSIHLRDVEQWPNGWPGEDYPTDEEIRKRNVERAMETEILHNEIIDLIDQHDHIFRIQWLDVNSLDAYVTEDFIKILEARDDVELINSLNIFPTSGGGLIDSNLSGQKLDYHSSFDAKYRDSVEKNTQRKLLLAADALHSAKNLPLQISEPKLKSPAQQIKDGTPISDIKCNADRTLTMLRDKPVCLKESTIQSLMSRGIIS